MVLSLFIVLLATNDFISQHDNKSCLTRHSRNDILQRKEKDTHIIEQNGGDINVKTNLHNEP